MSMASDRGPRTRGRDVQSAVLDAVVTSIMSKREPGQRRTVRRAVVDIAQARERRELADLEIRRGIAKLADLGLSQRDIGAVVGLSQAEVSRRLKRRALIDPAGSVREVILRRAAGELSTPQMLDMLTSMPLTAKVPRVRSAHDGAAALTGTAIQLMDALHDGLITEDEYEAVRAGRARTPRS